MSDGLWDFDWEYDQKQYYRPYYRESHPIFDPSKVWDYINQDKIWVDGGRKEHKIADLDSGYLFNILHWLKSNSAKIGLALEIGYKAGKAPDRTKPTSWATTAQNGIWFIEKSNLYRRIYQRSVNRTVVDGMPKKKKMV